MVYKSKWFHLFLDKLLFLFIFISSLISYLMVLSIDNPYSSTENAWMFYIPVIVIAGGLTISGFNTDRLKRIRGTKKEINQQYINEIISELKWDSEISNRDMTILTPSSEYLYNGGRQVTIIYDESDILVNSVAYSFFAGVSPFHFLSNRSIVRTIKKRFEEKINNNST